MLAARNLVIRGSRKLSRTVTNKASLNTNPFIFGGNLVLFGAGSLSADELLVDLEQKEAK